MLTVETSFVSTVAGICGSPGLKDGALTVNQLRFPKMVGVDAYGYVFIYDSGNGMIRMMDPVTGVVESMVDGACRIDHLAPNINAPFSIELRAMICYKAWFKRVVEFDQI